MTKITPEEFFNGNQMKIDIFKHKYAKNNESVDECFTRIADEISNAYYEDDKEKQYWTDRWARELLNDKWRPGGSIIASTNNPTKKISTFNCTGFTIDEDTLEAIHKTRYDASKAAAYRQGSGINFSKLRPKGTPINNSAEISEGVISWMKSFDRIADEVGQKGRIPALLFSLSVDHPDIEDFISCKDKLDTINNANISVLINDEFMKAVEDDKEWAMSFGSYGADTDCINVTTKIVKARYLLNKIAKHSWQTAEPGVLFLDNMKNGSIQEALGYEIETCNACSEKPLSSHSVCCLASINMSKVPNIDSKKFKPYIKEITQSLVRFMDNVNEYEIKNSFKSPLSEQLSIVKQLREIGLGFTNTHQWLYNQGLEYDSDEGIAAKEEFTRWYLYYAFIASAELAKERGPCPAWNEARRHDVLIDSISFKDLDGILNNIKKSDKKITPYLERIFKEFPDLAQLYYTTGIRNAALLSIAPTGSLSFTFSEDCLSTGIEPVIGRAYWQKTRATTKGNHYDYYFRLPDTVKEILLQEMKKYASSLSKEECSKFADGDFKTIDEFSGSVLDNNGKIGENILRIIDKYLPKNLLKTSHEIDPFKKIELISKVQKYVDASISVTFNLPKDFPVEEVERLYIESHKAGLKGISIYRDGCREGILLFEFPNSKEIKIKETDKRRPDDIFIHHAPKRPKTLPCEIFNILNHKIIIGLFNDKPYEVFIIDPEIKLTHHKVKYVLPNKGFIHKKSKQQYSLLDIDNNEILENLIDRELLTEEIKVLTRLTSTCLRHGVPLDFILRQLSLFTSDEKYPKAIANVLKKYDRLMLDVLSGDKKCNECGELLVKHEGCLVCMSCGVGGSCSAI
jgi:ribonucleoside-diphosphate reductase alpha chain